MVLGFGTITFRLDECHNLKAKRKIIKSIISRVQNSYNVGIAEVDFNDVHQRAKIGFAFVGNDRRAVNSKIDKMIEFIYQLSIADIIDSEMEIINI